MDHLALKEELQDQGLIIIPGFFDAQIIGQLQLAAKSIFEIQFKRFGIEGDYLNQMQLLFENHLEEFIACGKMIQSGLLELYQQAVDPELVALLRDLGLSHPLMCTRPVLFFNHPSLAKSEHFYKTPLHQDWTSMLASKDSVVVWVPLMDLELAHGPVIFYPGSHKLGPLSDRIENGFAEVDFDRNMYPQVQKAMKIGDIAIFSTLLVHESGAITNDEIRWSCHFRYTNMEDPTFIANGFPHPYIYKPSQELIDKYLQKHS
jgi:hypothetical protein